MLSEADVAYIREGFVALDDLCRRMGHEPAAVRTDIAAGRLPRASYVLDDGTEMVPADYFALVDEAGAVDHLHALFTRRYGAAAESEPESLADAEEEWQAYLSGEYGVCLKTVTPETIVRKSALVLRIEALLAETQPRDSEWASHLREAVDELDALERPFAAFDRVRFGGPSSRDRLITATHKAYPEIFAREGVET